MALWPNNRRDIIGAFPVGISAYLAFQETRQNTQKRLAYFGNLSVVPSSSIPEGAFQSAASILPPIVGGGLSSANSADDIVFTQTGNALAGGPVEGDGTITFTQTGGLALQVTLAGDGTIQVTQNGDLALTISLAADGGFTLTGTGGLSMIVPADGVATFSLTGAADLKGNSSLSGDITPFTELSPENLALAVWAQVLELGYSASDLMRLLTAVSVGKSTINDLGGGNADVAYRDLADTKDRVAASMTGSERTSVVLDAD